METSKQLFARRQELANAQAALVAEDKVDEARVIEGQIREIDRTLDYVLDEEQKIRDEHRDAPKAKLLTFAEAILGPRDEFRGLEVGFHNEAGESGESGASGPSVVTVTAPTEIDLSIPGKDAALLKNFASTLPSAPAAGSVSFKRRSSQYGEPGTWAGVVEGESASKEKVVYTWVDAVANKEATAGYVPISKDTLKDYDELFSIISSDLLIDLQEKVNAKYLTGNNNSGIVGVLNTVGIQSFTNHMGEMYFDAIRMMRTKIMDNARRIPTHVCMHPDIKQAIDLYKDENKRYQHLADDVMWGMQVIEDFDCAGILVFDVFSARKRPIHGISVEVGYVNDQFIKNELCLLAEETSALQVVRPDAFIYATKANLDTAAAS